MKVYYKSHPSQTMEQTFFPLETSCRSFNPVTSAGSNSVAPQSFSTYTKETSAPEFSELDYHRIAEAPRCTILREVTNQEQVIRSFEFPPSYSAIFNKKRKSNSINLPLHQANKRILGSPAVPSASYSDAFLSADDFEVDSWLDEFCSGSETGDNEDVLDLYVKSELNSHPEEFSDAWDSFPPPREDRKEEEKQKIVFTQEEPAYSEPKEEVKRKVIQKATPKKPRRSTSGQRKGSTSKPRQRRIKWSITELHQLWTGIFEYGNEWTEVQKNVSKRTYHQVKDKGRRLLQSECWITGKTKKDTNIAKGTAKKIARLVLHRYETTGKLSRDEEEVERSSKLDHIVMNHNYV